MARAFVSAGSNIEPEKSMRHALRLLVNDVRVRAVSTVYLTEPIGPPGRPSYYNCVIEIETALPPLALKYDVLHRIEGELGRERSIDKYAPRPIDLDLILYDSLVLAEKELTLPDPDILRRPFLIAALSELAPDLVLPGSEVSMAEASKNIHDDTMRPLSAYTGMLREELGHGLERRKSS